MKVLIALSILIEITLATNTTTASNERIVGGRPAPFIPWMVSLQNYGRHFCGAQLIGATTVLTAGHCVQGQYPSQVTARLGITNLNGGGGETIRVSQLIPHPEFDYNSLSNDVAIVKLAAPARTTQYVPLDTNGVAPGTSVVNYGWGAIYSGGPLSSTLLQVTLTVRDDSECEYSLQGFNGQWSICCHGPSDTETPCNGDSGGPLVANGVLVGTVSYGDSCRSYSAFARISNLYGFISQYL